MSFFSDLRTWSRGRRCALAALPCAGCQLRPHPLHPALAQQAVYPRFTYEKTSLAESSTKTRRVAHKQQAKGQTKGHLTFGSPAAGCSGSTAQFQELAIPTLPAPPLLPARTKLVASGPHCSSSLLSALSPWASEGFMMHALNPEPIPEHLAVAWHQKVC